MPLPEPQGDFEIVPVAIVTQAGETTNPVVFDLSNDSEWAMLRDEVRESFAAIVSPSGKFDPANSGHGVDIRLSAMTRGELDRLPEHQGW